MPEIPPEVFEAAAVAYAESLRDPHRTIDYLGRAREAAVTVAYEFGFQAGANAAVNASIDSEMAVGHA